MLEFSNVKFAYDNNINVLNDISFSVGSNEQVAIVGANGAGKTTLMKAVLGLLEAEGNINVSNVEVNGRTLSEIRRMVGYVSQDSDSQLFMSTVLEDIIFGPMNYGMTLDEATQIADITLKELDIEYLKNRKNLSLSSGEKRMAAIAVVLAMQPKLMLLDEPTSTLDAYHRRILINKLNGLPIAKLIATHDLDFVLETCDRVILLNHGTIVADGCALDVLGNKKLLEDNGLELPNCLAGLPARCSRALNEI